MRFPKFAAALAALCLALPTTAQNVQVFGGNGTRANTSLVLFGKNLMAGISITHGQPEWKDEYNQMFDKLKGKTLRLGKDLWTTLMTSVDLEIGGSKVPAGSYCAGLICDKDGKFSLALIDATKAMKKGLMPFGPQNWKPDATAPLTLNKDASEKAVSKMLMTLASDEEQPLNGSFTLAWGRHTLTAKLVVHAGKAEK